MTKALTGDELVIVEWDRATRSMWDGLQIIKRTGEGRQIARTKGVRMGRKPKLTPHRYASPPFGELVAATGRKSRKCPSLCSNGFQVHNRYRTNKYSPQSH
ncbi:MAG: hypothetical protein WAU78_09010 [Roseiarcus sp.]